MKEILVVSCKNRPILSYKKEEEEVTLVKPVVEVEVLESQCLLQASFVDIRPLLR